MGGAVRRLVQRVKGVLIRPIQLGVGFGGGIRGAVGIVLFYTGYRFVFGVDFDALFFLVEPVEHDAEQQHDGYGEDDFHDARN